MKITIFRKYGDILNPVFVSIDKALEGIRSGNAKDIVERIRASNNATEVSNLKHSLPCALYSGVFNIKVTKTRKDGSMYESYRTDESLSTHSKFVPFDIDDVDDIPRLKDDLMKDDYIYAVWVSPSGTGLHGLIKIADGNKHDAHYRALLKRYPFFDPTAKNPSRILFFSYDPDIRINKDSKVLFDVIEKEELPAMQMMSSGFTDYKKLDIAAKMIRVAEVGARHNAVIKASYLVGGFIAGGMVEASIGVEVLKHEVFKKFDADELDIEYQAIEDGVKAGQFMPINDVDRYQRQAMEEVGLVEDELSFLSNNVTDEDFIRRYRAGLIPMGMDFGYDCTKDKLLLKEGEFYALLGHSHVGKSAIGFWLAFLSALKYDWGWVIYTGENRVASVKMKFIEFYCGKKIKDVPENHFQQALSWVNERFFFVNNDNMYKYEELLSYAHTVSKYHSIKGVLIDPVNSLRTDNGNKYGHEMEMYTNMLLFTKRTGMTLILAIHTRTQSQRERGKDGGQLMPFPADADGGALLYNKVDVFITTNRDIQDPDNWMITEIHIGKQRNKETGGDVTKKGDPIKFKMRHGIEFTDVYDNLPFTRDYLKDDIKIAFRQEEDVEEIEEVPF